MDSNKDLYTQCTPSPQHLLTDSLPVATYHYIIDSVRLHDHPHSTVIPTREPQDYSSFHDYIITQPEWKQCMIGNIDLHDNNIQLIAENLGNGSTKIISDAGVWFRLGAFAYIIINEDIQDAKIQSAGPINANPITLSSFRAELGGILGAKILLDLMIEWHSIQHNRFLVKIICDNTPALKWINTPTERGIRYQLLPEYDLVNKIHTTLVWIQANTTTEHVKGHQDDTAEKELTQNAIWNIGCNHCIGDFLDSPTTGLKPQSTAPIILSSTVALSIDGTIVTSKIEDAIQNATNGTKLCACLQRKLNMAPGIFNLIDWSSHGLALSKMNINNQTCITKHLHGWLPTLERNHRFGFSTTSICPICKNEIETQSHIINCKHSHFWLNLTLQLQQAKAFLRPFLPFHQIWPIISSHITNTCAEGLNPTFSIINDPIGNLIQVAINQQQAIGWNQLLYGRIASSWGHVQEHYYKEYYSKHTDKNRPMHHNRTPFTSRLIQAFFCIFLGIWKQRNSILHNNISGSEWKSKLKTIHQLYNFGDYFFNNSDIFLLNLISLSQLMNMSSFSIFSG